MFKIIFNLALAFLVAIFILETTSVIRPFSESLIQNGILPGGEPGSTAPGIVELILMVLGSILVSLGPILEVLTDIIYALLGIILSIEITMSGLIYLLIIFFFLSFLYEKYRNMTLEVNKLKYDTQGAVSKLTLARALDETETHLRKFVKDQSTKKNSDLLEQATIIKELLSKINSSIDTGDNAVPERAKKGRRTKTTDLDKPKLKRKVKAKVKRKAKEEPTNILEDENISKIDLARALIESNDIKKAKELLMKAAETGTEAEMHEAKLLYLQLK